MTYVLITAAAATALMLIVVGAILGGCAPQITGSTYSDGRFWWTNVKSASDGAGGPRQDVIVAVDRDGHIVATITANGAGTLQSMASSLGPALVTATGVAYGNSLLRPARNTTDVRMDVQGTGGSGGAGGSNTVSGTATSSSQAVAP